MTDKTTFIAAMGGPGTLVGQSRDFVADDTTDGLIATGHGRQTGDGPLRLTTSSTLPAGLATGTDYWVVLVDANTLQLAPTLARALAGRVVDITDTGTGTHTLNATVQALADGIEDRLNNALWPDDANRLSKKQAIWAEAARAVDL